MIGHISRRPRWAVRGCCDGRVPRGSQRHGLVLARHGSIRGRAARLVAAGVAAITLWVCVGPAVRAAADDAAYAFAGTVVDPQGKPVAGAKVWFDYPLARPPAQPVPADAVSDAEGKFQFSRTKSSLADMLESPYPTIGVLVATKEGFGFAAGPADRFETTGRLAVDRPKLFRRRLGRRRSARAEKGPRVEARSRRRAAARTNSSTANGQPVAGATVEVLAVWAGENGTLDAWEAGMKKQPFWQHVSALFWRYNGAGAIVVYRAAGAGSEPLNRAVGHARGAGRQRQNRQRGAFHAQGDRPRAAGRAADSGRRL